MKNLLMFILLFQTLTGLACISNNEPSELNPSSDRHVTKTRELPKLDAASPGNSENPQYIGCWSGMRGGQLEITEKTIVDLGTGEKSTYEEIKTSRDSEYVKILLETTHSFEKSFLDRFVLISFRKDGMRAIQSYESYAKYEKDEISGFGFFGEVSCGELKNKRKR